MNTYQIMKNREDMRNQCVNDRLVRLWAGLTAMPGTGTTGLRGNWCRMICGWLITGVVSLGILPGWQQATAQDLSVTAATKEFLPELSEEYTGYAVTIPDSVTFIKNGAFDHLYSLTSVTIPDSVTRIGGTAFRFCSGLTSVTILDSVTTIGDYAFANCSSLTSVTIPESVTSIGERAFWG